MLGEKERIQVKERENEILEGVTSDLLTLKEINPAYAKRILQIFSYPENKGNVSYVKKIIQNSAKLGIPMHHRDDLYKYGYMQIKKNMRSTKNCVGVSGMFITNPIDKYINQDQYQQIVDMTGTKDIDGQSRQNKARLKDLTQNLQGAIVHPTALSVLFLVQQTLDCKDLQGKTILVAGKNGNFGSMVAALLERAGATTIGFNPKEDKKDSRHQAIKSADAVISVIRGANYFTQDYFEGFSGPIIDVTTENDGTGKTVGSVDRENCKNIPNTYIPSINGGVGTITNTLLMQNFSRCIINTEIENDIDPKQFEDFENMLTYENFGLNKEILTLS